MKRFQLSLKTSLGGTRTLKEVIKEVTSSHTEVIGEVTRSTGVIKKKTAIKNPPCDKKSNLLVPTAKPERIKLTA